MFLQPLHAPRTCTAEARSFIQNSLVKQFRMLVNCTNYKALLDELTFPTNPKPSLMLPGHMKNKGG